MKMLCDECGKHNYQSKILPEFDAGASLGLTKLMVRDFPALVCPGCGSVMTRDEEIGRIATMVLADLLRHETLSPDEARYVRYAVMDSQEKFACHLGVTRATVNRWETGAVVLDGTSSLAVRTHVFFRVYENEPRMRDLLEDLHKYFACVETPERRKAPRVVNGRLVAA